MASKKGKSLQPYPRRQPDGYLADDSLFPLPELSLTPSQLDEAIARAFERALKSKKGEKKKLPQSPQELVRLCLEHLRKRSDPVLSPFFLSQCEVEEIFELDAIAHEMQRRRMEIGVFYQFLVIELMRYRFPLTYDGKKEGDVEAEIYTPGFDRGLRLFMSVKKSADTVGGQDVEGMIKRLEAMAAAEKNLTRPYLCVACIATPPRGRIQSYSNSRLMRHDNEGNPRSPNCEVWLPGFIFPFVSGLQPNEVYKAALTKIGEFLPFFAHSQREECAKILTAELKKLDLVDETTSKINPVKFQEFISQPVAKKEKKS